MEHTVVEISDPFTKQEILQTLEEVNQTITAYFRALSPDQFFAHPPGVWSPAENLDHLVLAVKALLRGTRLPHLLIRTRFGNPTQPSRHYAEIRATYREKLANGGAAGGSVLPTVGDQPADAKAVQASLLAEWTKTANELIESAETWEEADLDSYQLPHMLLGLMTVRELLLWTIYHNLHHLNDTQPTLESMGNT